MNSYETVNEILVRIFHEVMDIEQEALITKEFSDITNNDMHIIDAIGKETPRNMSSIAKSLNITLGTLTISIQNLVKKGYVVRDRSEDDRRVVLISLTESGKRAYDHHQAFHRNMVEAALNTLNPEETQVLIKTLQAISDHLTK